MKITIFIKNYPKPVVLTTNESVDKVRRQIRKMMKVSTGIVEIEVENDVLFIDREDILSCLVSQ